MQYHSKISESMCLRFLAVILLLAVFVQGWSQTKPIEGIRENTPKVHAIINVKIVQAPGRVIEKGTIVMRDGVIESVGAQITPPPDARIWDYKGLTVYPGLIESYSHIGLPKEKKTPKQPSSATRQSTSQSTKQRKGPEHWNPHVQPEVNAMDNFQPKTEELQKYRSMGFTAALVVPDKGIFCGSGAIVSLGDGSANDQLLKNHVVQNIMFRRAGGFRSRVYPNSQMGIIALIRQTFMDADWYKRAQMAYSQNPNGQTRPEANESLEALGKTVQGMQPVMFNVDNDLNFLRAVNVIKDEEFKEYGLNTWVLGSGHEYRQLEAIKASGVPVILPLNFPEAPKVESPEEALSVSLENLSHWEAAPENPKRLNDAGVSFALSTAKLKKPSDFHKKVRESIERGLTTDAALSALTTVPAKLLSVENQLGTIDRGKLGHLVVADGDLFKEKTKILDVWVDGKRYEVKRKPEADPRGKWELTFSTPDAGPLKIALELKGDMEKLNGSFMRDSTRIKLQKVKLERKRLSMTFSGDSLGFAGVVRMSGRVEDKQLHGQGELPNGDWFTWNAAWHEALKADKSKSKEKMAKAPKPAPDPVNPPGAYGFSQTPKQPKYILVRNATIWTSGPEGNLENADMLMTQGKITKIEKNLDAPSDALIIEARGKHVTPGLIDAHSHSGLSSINEGSQAVTAEVRTSDVINSYDISLYRELAGGLTIANQLHGSANPIGGQNSIIKLRWGASPDALLVKDAKPGIKFALGENVKRSRSSNNTRYPDTRMGVEQIIRDRLKAALDYEKEWKRYNALKKKRGIIIPPRRDLELDTLLEIIHGKRYVHSHSYRQDEILMLVRVAEDFGFTIATFQHILEGYKIAEALAQHGAGASTFSDWWAYKFEVYDAIPYNGALMHNAGVVVSFNSDSGELARRMNLEAAKAVKYGGISEEEALKFVTLNPARQLRIDHRVGSLELGKDADFVIWSGHPLSTYTLCEQTWIDGRKYFDRQDDMEMQTQVKAERARLIQKVIAASSKDKKKKDNEKEKPTN